MEGGYATNEYHYGTMDLEVLKGKNNDYTGPKELRGMVCRIIMSMYGINQAGRIWGTIIMESV